MFEFLSKKFWTIILVALAIILVVVALTYKYNFADWTTYEDNVFSIDYPSDLKLEISKHGTATPNYLSMEDDIYIGTDDYGIDMTNGTIKNGFAILVSSNLGSNYTFDNFDLCSRDDDWIENSGSGRCLLASYIPVGIDYTNGKITKSEEIINGLPTIKYEFLSDNGRNNSMGLIMNTEKKSYVVAIAYKDYKNIKLFKKILDSFKLQ